MKVSVITPTIRKEGLKLVEDSLKRQTFPKDDFEWLIGSKFDPEISWSSWVIDDFSGGYWTLNRIYNRLVSIAKGTLVISLQDFIYIPPDGLQKFWDSYVDKSGIITGVGDQYEEVNKWGKPQIKIWSDPRKRLDQGSFYECYPNDAEWNWCAIPRDAFFRIGGMDEQLDTLGFGGDQLQAVQRMDAAGYKFFIDQTNESFTLRHGREDFGGQEAWDKNHVLFNGKYEQRMTELHTNSPWWKLQYLK